jgi:glycerophosphoryl diester phosphodiesterase
MSIVKEVFSLAARDFRRTWRDLLITDVVYKVAAFVILYPLVGAALRLFVSISGSSVLADQEILFFVLSPIGLLALVVVGAVSLAILAFQQACLMIIGLAVTQDARVTASNALLFGARHAGPVLRLTARLVLHLLLVATPFLAAGGLVYLTLLTEFDINYYLAERPPVFLSAAIIITVLLAVMAIVLIRLLLRWTFALPLLLFENARPVDALKWSSEESKGRLGAILPVVVLWAAGTTLFSSLVLGAVGLLGRSVLPSLAGSVSLLVLVTGGFVLLWSAVNLAVTFVSVSAFALLIVRLYDNLGLSKDARRAWAANSDLSEAEAGAGWGLTPKRLFAGTVLAGVLAAIAGTLLVESIRIDDNVLVAAHRGGASAAPENTLAAFERGIADGADFVELDVQETADGEVVVIHDSDLMKIGRTNVKVWDATYEQLQGIDIGSWFAPEFGDERIPKLEQVLLLCKGKVRVIIELKYYGHDERLEERVVEIVERTGMESQIIVMSLKYAAVEKMRKLRPDWTLGLLTATAVGNLTRLDADFLAVHTGLVTPSFVRAAHKSGKLVFAWTVNDPVMMATMIGRGVDSLITDEPAVAGTVIQELSEMNPVERLMVELSLWLGVKPKQAGPETDAS